jgi:WD40 repeat protein
MGIDDHLMSDGSLSKIAGTNSSSLSHGKWLVHVTRDRTVQLWDLTSDPPRKANVLKGDAARLTGASFSPDGRMLAACDLDGRVTVWAVASGERLKQWKLAGSVNAVAFAPDGKHLATANNNGTVNVLRLGDRFRITKRLSPLFQPLKRDPERQETARLLRAP